MDHAQLTDFAAYMPVFIERIVAPLLVFIVTGVIWQNPFKWDWQQKSTLFLAVLFLAYFFTYSSYRARQTSTPSAINQSATDATCSNVRADKNVTVNCTPSTESKDAPRTPPSSNP
jgi:membrane protein implicated in regulation of membrane protease activity